MAAPLLWSPYSESPSFLGRYWNLQVMKPQGLVVFEGDPPGDSVSIPMDLLPVGVGFFSSLLFMGVVLFPSFVLGNTSGEGGTFLYRLLHFLPLFLFLFFLLLLLLFQFLFFSFSFSFSFPSFSSFLSHSLFLSFPSLFLSFFRTSSFSSFFFFFFVLRELLVLFISEM